MASYRFHFSRNGEPLYQAAHEHNDDLDALDAAEILATECEIEIWCGGRFVARVKKSNAALTERDLLSG